MNSAARTLGSAFKSDPPIKQDFIRTSSIGECARRIGFSLQGMPTEPETSHSMFTLDMGTAIHLLIQKKLVELGWIRSTLSVSKGNIVWKNDKASGSGCELSFVDKKRRLTGHCDGITVPLVEIVGEDGQPYLVPGEGGKRFLVEIKSITDRPLFLVKGIRDGGHNPIREEDFPVETIDITPKPSRSSNKLQQLIFNLSHTRTVYTKHGARICPVYKLYVNGKQELVTILLITNILGKYDNLISPLPKHILQASIYADEFGLEDILFIYVGKDYSPSMYDEEDPLNIPIKIFHVKLDRNNILLIEDRIKDIYSYIDKGELPPREYGQDSYECMYCPYKTLCRPTV